MDQPARNRALAAFKRGNLRVLVATDVAARGIDVQDIACVLHVDVPTDADSYTHRSGRTGPSRSCVAGFGEPAYPWWVNRCRWDNQAKKKARAKPAK